jgi:nitrous oxidase accessory protein NosD
MDHRTCAALALAIVLGTPAHARKPVAATVACPEHTIRKGAVCTLSGDLALTRTLDVSSGVHLDCGGRRLVPGSPAPLVAVVVHDAVDAKVTNCHIEDFDQGIYVVRSVGRNWINDNLIVARVKGITLLGAVDTRVEGNTITVKTDVGAGIGIWRGSHRNRIRGNLITSLGEPAGEPPPADFPGDPVSYSPEQPAPAAGIIVGSSGLDHPIIQFILDGALYQLPHPGSVEDNVIEGNTITAHGVLGISLASRNLRTIVRGNTVIAGDAARRSRGINIGPGNRGPALLPSVCAQQPERACVQDLDCNGRLDDDPPDDECAAPPTQVTGDYTSHGVLVEGNTVAGAGLGIGIDAGAAGMTIAGNRVTGAAGAGLSLFRSALGDARIEGNVLADNGIGVSLGAPVGPVGLIFTRNDVTGSLSPIQAPAGWSVPLELSSDGEGNHWGLSCPDAFPGAPSPLITDSFPYGAPIAAPDGASPVPCGE